MKLLMRVLALNIALCFLAACGPAYQTFYHYRSPLDREGKRCLNECIHIQENCKGQCRQQRASCEHRHTMSDMLHNMLAANQERENEKRYYSRDTSSECGYEATRCERQCFPLYNDCYTNCGGEVMTETRCVARCE